MKYINKLFLTFILFILFIIVSSQIFVGQSLAADPITVSFGGNNNSPLFNLSNMNPGDTSTKVITVTNNGTTNQLVGIRGVVMNQTGNISDVMHILITNNATTVYGNNGTKTLTQFFTDSANGSFISLTTLPAHQTTTYNVSVVFDQSAGNQYQGKLVNFSIIVGSDVSVQPTITPTPTKSPIPTPTPKPLLTFQQIISQFVQLFKSFFPNILNTK